MGTNGTIGFVIDSNYKCVYNQSDSYPEGLGVEVVEALNQVIDNNQLLELKNKISEISWVDEESQPSRAAIAYYSTKELGNDRVARQTLEDWYCLLREAQGAIAIPLIISGELRHLVDASDYGVQAWNYIINFDSTKLEILEGEIKIAEFDLDKPIDIDAMKRLEP